MLLRPNNHNSTTHALTKFLFLKPLIIVGGKIFSKNKTTSWEVFCPFLVKLKESERLPGKYNKDNNFKEIENLKLSTDTYIRNMCDHGNLDDAE